MYIIHVIKLECDSELNNFIAIFSFLYNCIVPTEKIACIDRRRSFEEAAGKIEHIGQREELGCTTSSCGNTIRLRIFDSTLGVEFEFEAALEHFMITAFSQGSSRQFGESGEFDAVFEHFGVAMFIQGSGRQCRCSGERDAISEHFRVAHPSRGGGRQCRGSGERSATSEHATVAAIV